MARLHRREECVERAGDSAGTASEVTLLDHERLPSLEKNRRSERPDPDLGAGEILDDRDVPPEHTGGRPNAAADFFVGGRIAVREVQPERVSASLEQRFDGRLIRTGGADGRKDACARHQRCWQRTIRAAWTTTTNRDKVRGWRLKVMTRPSRPLRNRPGRGNRPTTSGCARSTWSFRSSRSA